MKSNIDLTGIERAVSRTAPLSLREGRQLFVACSGGVDSMLLMHMLDRLARSCNWHAPIILYVNYGLRGEASDADERLVQEQAKARQLTCYVRRLEPSDHPKSPDDSGIQQWARELRQTWFASHLRDGDVLALAHHQDDLAENILMRLGRGTGLRLAGMSRYKPPYWRPLLDHNKETIRKEASRQKVSFREDESNDKLVYSRNYVRWKVIPELKQRFPGFVTKLAAFADDLEDLAASLEQQYHDWIVAEDLQGAWLRSVNKGTGCFILAAYLKRQLGHVQLQRSTLLRALDALERAEHEPSSQWSEELEGHFCILMQHDSLRVRRGKHAFGLRESQHKANIQRHDCGMWLEKGANIQVDLARFRSRLSGTEDFNRPQAYNDSTGIESISHEPFMRKKLRLTER